MKRWQAPALIGLAAALAAPPATRAQREPRIGYIYPAGGQAGTSLEVTIGGQYLEGVTAAAVFGGDVESQVLKHTKPLTPKQFTELREKIRQLEERVRGARGAGAQPAAGTPEAADRQAQLARDTSELAELRKLLPLNPNRQQNPQLSETVLLQVALPATAAPGVRELRLATPAGLSNPLAFRIGAWPEYREQEPNDREPNAELPAPLPLVINGQIMPGDVDRFRFAARRGQRLVAGARARELVPYLADAVPGWFQATLALRDHAGAELAYADDFRFQPDPVLFFEVPADGEYVVEIEDAIYRGREDFVYRIALGEIPYVTSVFPLGCRAGTETTLALDGWNLPENRLALDLRARSEPGSIILGHHELPPHGPWNSVAVAVDTLPESIEEEPNDAPEHAPELALPHLVNGRIGRPGDCDLFRFAGRAGQELVAEIQARRLGSPLDAVLVLTDAGGRQLAANDDSEDRSAGLITHHADARIQVTLDADATYCLRVGDARHAGGEDHAYRLRISPPRPDFALRATPSALNARPGETVPFTIHALRQDGFAGRIALSLRDAPPGFVLGGAWVPAGQDRARLTLTVPRAAGPAPARLWLEGRADIGGAQLRRDAVPAEDMMQAFFYRHLVPVRAEWLVAVDERARPRQPARLATRGPVRLAAGGTASVRYEMPTPAAGAPIELALSEPPAGILIDSVARERGGLQVVLRADAASAQPGLQGNLILEAFTMRTPPAREDRPPQGPQRVSLGVLPAIPFEVEPPPAAAGP